MTPEQIEQTQELENQLIELHFSLRGLGTVTNEPIQGLAEQTIQSLLPLFSEEYKKVMRARIESKISKIALKLTIPRSLVNNLYIIGCYYFAASEDDVEEVTLHKVRANTPEEAVAILQDLLVAESKANNPDYIAPITWETERYEGNRRGYLLSEPLLIPQNKEI